MTRRSLQTLLALLALASSTASVQPLSGQALAGVLEAGRVGYRASDERGAFEGVAPLEALELHLDPDDPSRNRLRGVLRPERFDSGIAIRDINARRTVFETEAFPEIVFEASGFSSASLPAAGETELQLEGLLTMHGVTQPIALTARLSRAGERLVATGAFSVLLSDFGMSRPRFLAWQVRDEVEITFELTLRLGPR